jgi:hypothetical protein
VLAGCSGSSGSGPAQIDSDRVSAGASASGAGSDGAAGKTVSGAELAQRVQAAMRAAGSATFRLQSSTTSGQDASGSGAVRVRFDFSDGQDTLRVIAVPGVLYADVGEVVDGRHWLKVTATGKDALSSAMAPLLSYMTSSADVSAQTSTWTAAGGFTVGAPGPVPGAPGSTGTPYTGTIPRAAVQAGLPEEFRALMRKDITGDSHLTLWLDGQDRPLKVVSSGSYDGKSDEVTVTYDDWGSAPTVTEPPAADVIKP